MNWLHLDGGVDGFETAVGEPVVEVGQDVGQMALDRLVHLGHGLQPAVSGPQNQRAKNFSITVTWLQSQSGRRLSLRIRPRPLG